MYPYSNFSAAHICGAKGAKGPTYSSSSSSDQGYAGDKFWFDPNNLEFCGSTAVDGTSAGLWSSEAKCSIGGGNQYEVWVNVQFSDDQSGCNSEKNWDIPKDQEFVDIYNMILNGCKLIISAILREKPIAN